MNTSTLSPLKNKSIIKSKQTINLPPLNHSQTLQYHNDYQNYQDQLHQFKIKNKQSINIDNNSSSVSSIISSSLSSHSKNHIQSSPQYSMKSPQSQIKSPQSIKKSVKQQIKQVQKIIPYEDSVNFWKSNVNGPNPYIQYSQKEQYRNISSQQIQKQIKSMRKQIIQMNDKLSQMLELYNMAKTQFVSKQLISPSKGQFYQVQIQTNKKIQQAQLAQLRKLNETQFIIKDKDVLLDLQQVLIQMKQQLHQAKKQEHDSNLKNHKQDMVLDEIIKINSDNKDNNAVKLLKLQIIYYMKKQNSLKIHEQQLDHQHKLITQNDKNLNIKIQQLKSTNKHYYMFDDKYQRMKNKYDQLVDKKKLLIKNIQTIKRSNDIIQQKCARQLIDIDNQIRKVIQPAIISYQQDNQQIQHKINTIITAYHINQVKLKNINWKFSQQLIYKHKSNKSTKPLLTNILKPNLIPKSKLQQQTFLHQKKQLHNYIPNSNSNYNYKLNQKINQITKLDRYNDKNISMTIDVDDTKLRSISQGINNLKPKNFRIFSKRQKQTHSKLDKHTSLSTTIDYNNKNQIKTLNIHHHKLFKPNLINIKTNKN